MGRPRKSEDTKRAYQIVIKLNLQEYKQLQVMMEYAERNASEVIRQLVFKERLLKPRVPLIEAQTYTELKRIGNNLNQYVKAVHQSRLDRVDRQVLNELREILDLMGKYILKL